HMSGGFSDCRGTVKNSVYRFIKRIPLFVLAAFVEVRFYFVEETTQGTHGLTLLLDQSEIVAQNRTIFVLAWAHESAQSQVFFIQFQTTEFLSGFGIANNERTQ